MRLRRVREKTGKQNNAGNVENEGETRGRGKDMKKREGIVRRYRKSMRKETIR